MNKVIPTPYDITPPSYIPWEPGMLAWGVILFVVLSLILSALYCFKIKKNSRKETYSINMAFTQLQELAAELSKNLDKETAAQFLLLSKRILDVTLQGKISSFSAQKLHQFGVEKNNQELIKLSDLFEGIESYVYNNDSFENVRLNFDEICKIIIYQKRLLSALK